MDSELRERTLAANIARRNRLSRLETILDDLIEDGHTMELESLGERLVSELNDDLDFEIKTQICADDLPVFENLEILEEDDSKSIFEIPAPQKSIIVISEYSDKQIPHNEQDEIISLYSSSSRISSVEVDSVMLALGHDNIEMDDDFFRCAIRKETDVDLIPFSKKIGLLSKKLRNCHKCKIMKATEQNIFCRSCFQKNLDTIRKRDPMEPEFFKKVKLSVELLEIPNEIRLD